MGPVKVVTLWPALSSAATCTGGMAVPAAVVWGCCVNERVRADPGPGLGTAVMLNGVLSWATSPPPMVGTSGSAEFVGGSAATCGVEATGVSQVLRMGAGVSHSASIGHGRHSRHGGGPAKFLPCTSAA